MWFVVCLALTSHVVSTAVVGSRHLKRRESGKKDAVQTSANLQNISGQVTQFQGMMTAHSTELETILREQQKGNQAAENVSERIRAGNKVLEASNHVLAQQAKSFIDKNHQLRVQMKGLSAKLRTAQAMAAAVDAFHGDGMDKDDEREDAIGNADLKSSLLLVTAETQRQSQEAAQHQQGQTDQEDGEEAGARAALRALAQEERTSLDKLQHSFELALAEGKRKHVQVQEIQRKLNATRLTLEGRRSRLTSMVAHLQASTTKLEKRVRTITGFLQRLAGIASGQAAPTGAVQRHNASTAPAAPHVGAIPNASASGKPSTSQSKAMAI